MSRSSCGSSAFAGRRAWILLSAICATFCWSACDTATSARAWPPGTLVAIDEISVTADEIALDVAAVMLVEPQWTEVNLKRLAFNEIALPRALLRARTSIAAREAARRSIDEQFARIQGGKQFGPPTTTGAIGHELSGTWRQIGLLTWGTAMSLEAGSWSEVFEVPGAFLRVRVLERIPGSVPEAMWLRLDTIESSYTAQLEPVTDQAARLKAHRLTIVDPAWEAIVPERTKYLMRAHKE